MAAEPSSSGERHGLSVLARSAAVASQPEGASSPRTPQRKISSTFSSPSLAYRSEEDAAIFELGNRHLSAGFAGEGLPRCTTYFGPEFGRREGDYSQWLPGYKQHKAKRRKLDTFGDDHELWQMDLRGLDLGAVGDKVERAVRLAYERYLLLDSKSRRALVVLPSTMPYQLLARVVQTLFVNFQMPSITLMSPQIAATVGAGCRSSLHVDIGWRETIVTAVYEYRVVRTGRTVRGMRMLVAELARVLDTVQHGEPASDPHDGAQGGHEPPEFVNVDLDDVEEVLQRVVWCPLRAQTGSTEKGRASDEYVSIPSSTKPRHQHQVPASRMTGAVEDILLNCHHDPAVPVDDDELPIQGAVYNCLASLPPDIRATCMSRVTFSGGGSNIPGLQSRIMNEISHFIDVRGWRAAQGKAADEQRRRAMARTHAAPTRLTAASSPPASSRTPLIQDEIDEKLHRQNLRDSPAPVQGTLRCIRTLGPWAGASLLSNLHVQGVVEIDREAFLQHGLAGARAEYIDASAHGGHVVTAGRKSLAGGEARGAWSLGTWA